MYLPRIDGVLAVLEADGGRSGNHGAPARATLITGAASVQLRRGRKLRLGIMAVPTLALTITDGVHRAPSVPAVHP